MSNLCILVEDDGSEQVKIGEVAERPLGNARDRGYLPVAAGVGHVCPGGARSPGGDGRRPLPDLRSDAFGGACLRCGCGCRSGYRIGSGTGAGGAFGCTTVALFDV